MKLAIVGCGLMGSGVASLASGEAELTLIDLNEEKALALARAYGAAHACELRAAKDADIIAVVLPAPAIEAACLELAACAKRGAIVLDMATKGTIPRRAIDSRPDVRFVEAKIIGSGLGVAHGLKAMLVVGTEDERVMSALRSALPGFASILPGDTALVPEINAKGAYFGIRAAVETEEALREMGVPREWIKCASGCLVPGSSIGYSEGKMGEFNRNIANRILAEREERR